MQDELLDLLEELLSLTEIFRGRMDSEDLRRWKQISARVADIRLGGENADDLEL